MSIFARGMVGLITLLLLAKGAIATPLEVGAVDSGARWVIHLDVEKLWASPLGQVIKDEVAASPVQAKMDALALVFGFDPLRDLQGLTFYGSAPGKAQGVMLAKGNFNQDHILTLLRGTDGYANKTGRGGDTLHHWIDKNTPAGDPTAGERWGAFHGASLIVVGNTEAIVESALAVLDGRSTAMTAQSTVGGCKIEPDGTIFLLAAATPPAHKNADPKNQRAIIMQNTEGVSLRLSERAGGVLDLVMFLRAKAAGDAAFVEQVAIGLQAISILSQKRQTPQAKVLETIAFSRDGQTVKAELVCTPKELTLLCQQMKAGRPQPPNAP